MIEVKLKLDNQNKGGFFLYDQNEQIGQMTLSITNDIITVYHTEVNEKYNGKGYAKKMLDALVTYAQEHDYKIIPLCPYVHAQFKKHPDLYSELWKKE